MSSARDIFVLYRILGNDLRPRHGRGQTARNVKFILDNEPKFECCIKRWIVNRIICREDQQQVVALLEMYHQSYEIIPFKLAEYAGTEWESECFPDTAFFSSGQVDRLSERNRLSAAQRARRQKINYVMNVNGARNTALRAGRALARWVLPWDGNCFLTGPGWDALVRLSRQCADAKYLIVPMARLTDNHQADDPAVAMLATDEPQIAFRSDAAESFDENYPYGRRSKVELLQRLGVTGRWDHWPLRPWDLPYPRRSAEAGRFVTGAWVARLTSGYPSLERGPEALVQRGIARGRAIISTIDGLDRQLVGSRLDPARLTSFRPEMLESVRSAEVGDHLHAVISRLGRDARSAIERETYTVVAKDGLPPSNDRHDYCSLAPYWWPDPAQPDGLPHVRRDGQIYPPAALNGPESQRYDRGRLQLLVNDTTTVALAWWLTGEDRYAQHGGALVRTWFIDPATRMNPHLRYAQVRCGHPVGRNSSGIIELKDLYYLLDAVRMLETSAALDPNDVEAFRSWLADYRNWLAHSDQGRWECQVANNHGTYYDLQLGAIAAYLGDTQTLIDIFRRLPERIRIHFAPDGGQPGESARTRPLHYRHFNLQGWVNLATLAQRCGEDLWGYRSSDGRGLQRALESLLFGECTGHPDTGESGFDPDRRLPLRAAYEEHYGDPEAARKLLVEQASAARELMFAPTTGIRPYWFL